MNKLRVLDLFSGIGGFSLGLEMTGGFETVAFCEIDLFCRKVLARHWPNVPIIEDIHNVRRDTVETVDVICGGFPCQPFSASGNQLGEDDPRYLWPELARVIGDFRPRFFILENVPNLLSIDSGNIFRGILRDIAEIGYDAEWHVIPASAVGAPHRRDRLWIVGYPQRQHDTRQLICGEFDQTWPEAQLGKLVRVPGTAFRDEAVAVFGGMDDGIPDRVDRLRALGNTIVPKLAAYIGKCIITANP